jgi:DMATS type aromatic prenyltransferase
MGSIASSAHGISLGEIGRKKLHSLAASLGLSETLTTRALDVFAMMSGSWGFWQLGDSPAWPNDISDDGTPFEFSASFDGASPRLRMLTESQVDPISATSSWTAGLSFGQRLGAKGLADLTLFQEIQDLFAPTGASRARFLLWHAAVLEEAQPVLYKAYLNPCVLGAASAPKVVEQALRRLGFDEAWRFLERRLAPEFAARIRYFSVDLEPAGSARVKVYLACSQSAKAVQRLIDGADNVQPGDAREWLEALTGSQGPFDSRPILSCFAFRRSAPVPDVTVHVPIRCYVKHDAEAVARVSALLSPADAARLSRSLGAVANRALDVGRGLLTYASLRREAAATRVTVYIAPEAYSITSRRPSVPPPSDSISGVHQTSQRAPLASYEDMGQVLALIQRQCEVLVGEHPLLLRLKLPGTLEQSQHLGSYLSLFVLWVGDLLRFAEERTTDPLIVARMSQRSSAERTTRLQFLSALDTLGVRREAPPLFSDDHQLLREITFAWVAQVIAAHDDSVRLGIVLLAASVSRELLQSALGFIARSTGTSDAPTVDFVPDSLPGLEAVVLPYDVVSKVYTGVDRSLESMLAMMAAVHSAVFSSASR